MPKGSAACQLTGKFGCTPDAGVELLKLAATVAKTGLSFHVGSQTLSPSSYVDAIRKDLSTMIEEAQGLGYGTLPVTAAALGCFDRASQSGGLGDADSTQLPSWWVENGKV